MRMKLIQTVPVEIPAYALELLSESHILVAGGGGNVNSGIDNQFRIYSITKDSFLKLEMVYQLPMKDAPMSLTIDLSNKIILAGINELSTTLTNGKNHHLHLFQYNQEKKMITILKSISIFPQSSNNDWDNYQRITRFNYRRTLLAIASANGYFALLKYPSLKLLSTVASIKPMVMDLDFSLDDSKLVYVSSSKLYTHILSTKRLIHVQSLKEGSFRTIRWINKNSLITIIHRHGKSPLLQRWDSDFSTENDINSKKTLWSQTNARSLYKTSRAVTSMEIAHNYGCIVVACADLSIIIIDIYTLTILKRKTKIHEFSITSLIIHPKGTHIFTASADARLQVIKVSYKKGSSTTVFFLFFATIAGILAIISIIYPVFNQKLAKYYLTLFRLLIRN
ncbi:hypothetical protein PNEG_00400 [Pneumocystis murina B123]|uniref:Guanine nucleotide-exchange factor SEC12 n=1 Tax=Pneumocystis murina (strain B123) TaxID=1069680 RepID=M7PLP4_PNEMU|nr:hypothetical protein PNEG_00400 [Pneumocystis murina B123]EMR11374.1 hypothetical protein PNEG_00400 [Pneumocystis murina B123]